MNDCSSGKIVYTRIEAKRAAGRIRQRGGPPQRPYKCAECRRWHLHSAPKDKS